VSLILALSELALMDSLLSTLQLAIVQQLCFVGDILLLSSPDLVFQSNVFDFFYKRIRQAFQHGKI
jgi:hypothetical protein